MNYFQKLYEAFETCKLVKNNLCGKLFSSLGSPITFDESFKVNSVLFFILDFDLLSCELGCYIESFYITIILK